MIPRRRPPFGTLQIIGSILSCLNKVSVEQIEQAYAEAFDIPHVILLPSGRAGLCWALKAVIGKGCNIVCPVFTCDTVWEAVIRAGGQLRLIDAEKNGFLMDRAALSEAQVGNYALVLCEIYGYTYELEKITRQASNAPAIRIVDMAMTVPVKEHFERLVSNDFAFLSFGIGKCMYSGWGGVGFTKDKKLAEKIKQMRNAATTSADLLLGIKRSLKIVARTMAHNRLIYGFSRKLREKTINNKKSFSYSGFGNSFDLLGSKRLDPEWFLPSTYVDRRLSFYNLIHSKEYVRYRQILFERYHQCFDGIPGIACPEKSRYPLSCYTIRVEPAVRDPLKKYLWDVGVDVGTLFTFPESLSSSEFANASRASLEVLNLPLHSKVCIKDVDIISTYVVKGFKLITEGKAYELK